jgi:hypothetical protein
VYPATLLGEADEAVLQYFILVVALLLDPAAVILLLASARARRLNMSALPAASPTCRGPPVQAASSWTKDATACHPGKCSRPQASRVTLAKSCRSNNSSGDGLAHHVGLHVRLPGVLKLLERSVESVTHRRNRLRSERSGLHQ